ncbi:unnamed protein product, partial [Discosporangium mesarthrocarpum]
MRGNYECGKTKAKGCKEGGESFAGPPCESPQDLPTRGLLNLGNTCFFNSALQNLFRTLPLHEVMFSHPEPYGEQPAGSVTRALKRTFKDMRSPGESRPYSPSPLLSAVQRSWPQFKGFNQQDAHELFMCVLCSLEEEELDARKRKAKALAEVNAKGGTESEEAALTEPSGSPSSQDRAVGKFARESDTTTMAAVGPGHLLGAGEEEPPLGGKRSVTSTPVPVEGGNCEGGSGTSSGAAGKSTEKMANDEGSAAEEEDARGGERVDTTTDWNGEKESWEQLLSNPSPRDQPALVNAVNTAGSGAGNAPPSLGDPPCHYSKTEGGKDGGVSADFKASKPSPERGYRVTVSGEEGGQTALPLSPGPQGNNALLGGLSHTHAVPGVKEGANKESSRQVTETGVSPDPVCPPGAAMATAIAEPPKETGRTAAMVAATLAAPAAPRQNSPCPSPPPAPTPPRPQPRLSVQEVYGGKMCSELTCRRCEARSYSVEDCFCLSLEIPGHSSLMGRGGRGRAAPGNQAAAERGGNIGAGSGKPSHRAWKEGKAGVATVVVETHKGRRGFAVTEQDRVEGLSQQQQHQQHQQQEQASVDATPKGKTKKQQQKEKKQQQQRRRKEETQVWAEQKTGAADRKPLVEEEERDIGSCVSPRADPPTNPPSEDNPLDQYGGGGEGEERAAGACATERKACTATEPAQPKGTSRETGDGLGCGWDEEGTIEAIKGKGQGPSTNRAGGEREEAALGASTPGGTRVVAPEAENSMLRTGEGVEEEGVGEGPAEGCPRNPALRLLNWGDKEAHLDRAGSADRCEEGRQSVTDTGGAGEGEHVAQEGAGSLSSEADITTVEGDESR